MELHQFQEIFLESLKGPLPELLDLRTEAITSIYMDMSPVQDSFRYRAKRLGLKVAGLLIDEKGELDQTRLNELNQLLDRAPFILGPGREGDALIYAHLRKCLLLLAGKKEIWTAIRRFSSPLCHKKADEIIRDTLWPEPIRSVQTVHVRKAVMASWLTLLRQSAGSCFATAPAILIQQDYPMQFFKDLYDILSTGQLKRTVAGKQYSVPLSLSAGKGDLQKTAFSLETSPGVIAALEAGGVVITATIQQKIREQGPQTVERLLRPLLLEDVGLTEEDLQDEENLSRIQMTALLARNTAVYYQRPSVRAQKVSDWKKKLTKASTTFVTFTECALLRTWEYTIASFCDVKTEFARWNLYIGLGIHPDQNEGIGSFLYGQVDRLLQKCNQEIEGLSKEYEQEIAAIQAIETMINGSGSDVRRNQLKSELMSHSLAVNSIHELRNHLVAKAEGLAGFFSLLIEQYDHKLQDYFQELFDPALFGEGTDIFDDSSAGFRLVYKHGRLDASQWTAIYTGEQYIDCLREFFSNIENDIATPPQIGRELVSEITTALIQFIQEPKFLAGALRRSHEAGRKSPWDYISGGTLQTLLMTYCNRDKPFTESGIIPHSEVELMHFLSHAKRESPLLMHSPTHAFIFYPELLPKSAELERKAVQKWDELMQEHLTHRVSERLPEEERALFIHLYRQKNATENNTQFRTFLIEALGPRIKNKIAIIDSVLYEQTPLFTQTQAIEAVEKILLTMGKSERVEKLKGSFFSSFELCQITKAILLKKMVGPFSSVDWDHKIAETMRHLGLCQSHPFLFADTNWSAWFFGFVTNPATGQLEFWRLNRNATQGFPMLDWKEWMNQKNSSAWILLSEAKEYIDEF